MNKWLCMIKLTLSLMCILLMVSIYWNMGARMPNSIKCNILGVALLRASASALYWLKLFQLQKSEMNVVFFCDRGTTDRIL